MDTFNKELTEWVDRELQLNRLHEEIVAKRESLLHCSKTYLRNQDARAASTVVDLEMAVERNTRLLKDVELLEETLADYLINDPTPRFSALHNNYWSMVRSQVPLWEEHIGLRKSVHKDNKK